MGDSRPYVDRPDQPTPPGEPSALVKRIAEAVEETVGVMNRLSDMTLAEIISTSGLAELEEKCRDAREIVDGHRMLIADLEARLEALEHPPVPEVLHTISQLCETENGRKLLRYQKLTEERLAAAENSENLWEAAANRLERERDDLLAQGTLLRGRDLGYEQVLRERDEARGRLKAITSRHQNEPGCVECAWCGEDWPCETRRLATEKGE